MRTKFKKTTPKWTERRIQGVLAKWAIDKGHVNIIPNCGVFGWEADLVSTTKKLLGHEYEIKISVSDFRADSKKRKHWWLTRPFLSHRRTYPSYFWYVLPAELVEKVMAEVPEYAGVLQVESWGMKLIKNAPRLHTTPLTGRQIEYINRGLMFRYWRYTHDSRC